MDRRADRIWLSLAHMGGSELKYVQDAFDTNWVAPLGPNVRLFEERLGAYLGIDAGRVVALSSGTSAIHLALRQLGVGAGDVVICQSFTFVASANPIAYLGAEAVFVDSEEGTWNMCPALLREAIVGTRASRGFLPKAIVVVDLYGMPARMEEIVGIASEFGIPVVEDAAEALGSTYAGKPCGTLGTYGALSFNGNKVITTSGGGALVCPSLEAAKEVLHLATQARDEAPHYQHSRVGYNYRLSNVSAGIGCGQMEVLAEHVLRRQAIHAEYARLLHEVRGVRVKSLPLHNATSNYWLTCIELSADYDRESLRIWLDSHNVESRPLWKPMHMQPLFKGNRSYSTGVSEHLFATGLCLPSGSGLGDEEVFYVAGLVREFCEEHAQK